VVRQVFNDTDATVLWLVVGAPPEGADTRTMSDEQLADLYPDGPRALPPGARALAATGTRRGAEATPC
jgi:hypothetical protein